MLEAIFTKGIDEIEVSGLFQWDRGQKINITVMDGLPNIFQVHFTYQGATSALSVAVLDSTEVEIPDEVLTQPLDVVAYVYLIDEEGGGETVKTIHLPLTPRQKPEDYSALPASTQERIEAMVASISNKADNAVLVATEAKTVAEDSVAVSAQSAESAATDAARAAESAEAAQAAAEAARDAVDLSEEQIQALMGDIDCGTFTDTSGGE